MERRGKRERKEVPLATGICFSCSSKARKPFPLNFLAVLCADCLTVYNELEQPARSANAFVSAPTMVFVLVFEEGG